jgi:hypothetical protein
VLSIATARWRNGYAGTGNRLVSWFNSRLGLQAIPGSVEQVEDSADCASDNHREIVKDGTPGLGALATHTLDREHRALMERLQRIATQVDERTLRQFEALQREDDSARQQILTVREELEALQDSFPEQLNPIRSQCESFGRQLQTAEQRFKCATSGSVLCIPRIHVPREESAGERRTSICLLPARDKPESADVHHPGPSGAGLFTITATTPCKIWLRRTIRTSSDKQVREKVNSSTSAQTEKHLYNLWGCGWNEWVKRGITDGLPRNA